MVRGAASVVTLLVSALLLVLVLPDRGADAATAAGRMVVSSPFSADQEAPSPETEQEGTSGHHGSGSAVLRALGQPHKCASCPRRQLSQSAVAAVAPIAATWPARLVRGDGLPADAGQPPTPATLQVFRC
ncbi:hypothetical protein ACQPZZ_04490 [Microbispora sp. CA-135349]|uniref:hypothetical protein n=1 Tax=Microbispora sp. CA-135349 TaxID=3239953 RepID=UPI003D94792D